MIRYQQTGNALGSEIYLTILLKDESRSNDIFRILWASIKSFENRFSRFKPNSELTLVNSNSGSPTEVSDEFIALISKAYKLSEKTNGLYNPFVLPALQQAGYKGSWPNPNKFDKLLDYSERSKIVSYKNILIKKNDLTIPKNSALDFGGIGKGYLLDQLADILESNKVQNYWISLGGDLICRGHNIENEPWAIGLSKADKPEEILSKITNTDGERLAIATSGITKRRGENWHHIIDPRTGVSADTKVQTATVSAKNGALADVYAKCLVIVGKDKASDLINGVTVHTAVLQVLVNNKIQVIVLKGKLNGSRSVLPVNG